MKIAISMLVILFFQISMAETSKDNKPTEFTNDSSQQLLLQLNKKRTETPNEVKFYPKEISLPSLKDLNKLNLGNEGGHGGDTYALEFISLGNILFDYLGDDMAQLSIDRNAASNFKEALKKVRVVSLDHQYMVLNDEEVSGINFPDKYLIKINQEAWRQSTLNQKLKLVLHEYFGIINVERDNYSESFKYTKKITQISDSISSNPLFKDLMVNLFYGQCKSIPAIADPEICRSGSENLRKAEVCSIALAEANCKMSGKVNCQKIETTYTPIISSEYVGVRYCEVQTIVK